MVSVAMQESSSAPKAMLAWGMAGFRSEVCLARDVIKLSSTCVAQLCSAPLRHHRADSELHVLLL